MSNIYRAFLRSLLAGFLLSVLTQCAAPEKPKYGRKPPRNFYKALGQLAPGAVQDSLATPPHNFSRSDYPFDAQGNYREDWVQAGSSSRSNASSRSSGTRSSTGVRYHVVKGGDTLFGLSRRYGVTLYSLRRENGLSDYTIRKGQVLKIPAGN